MCSEEVIKRAIEDNAKVLNTGLISMVIPYILQ